MATPAGASTTSAMKAGGSPARVSVGVFVSFASLFVYTFGIFLKPLAEEFPWSREAGLGRLRHRGDDRGRLLAAARLPLDRFGPRRVIVPCVAVFGVAFASLALLTPHLWHLYAIFAVLGVVGNGTAHMAYSRAVSSWFTARAASRWR